jgi:hypothetical protein
MLVSGPVFKRECPCRFRQGFVRSPLRIMNLVGLGFPLSSSGSGSVSGSVSIPIILSTPIPTPTPMMRGFQITEGMDR